MASISSLKNEKLLIKWLLAEAIHYKNQGKVISNSYGLRWATKTRIQKILFSVIDQFDLPITRSWYVWGGFVHSDILANDNFTSFRYDYSKNPDRALGFRQKVRHLGVPTNEILDSLAEHIDEITTMPSKIFLVKYYGRESPEEFRQVYLSKQKLSNFFYDLTEINPDDYQAIGKKIDEIENMISDFHLSTNEIFEDEKLDEIKIRFSDIVETALDKLDLMAQDSIRIPVTRFSFFQEAKHTFDNFVWNSYACKVSQDTITGLRAETEREKMKRHEKQKISQSDEKLDELGCELVKRKLELSCEDLQKYKKSMFEDKQTSKALSDLIGIYCRAGKRE